MTYNPDANRGSAIERGREGTAADPDAHGRRRQRPLYRVDAHERRMAHRGCRHVSESVVVGALPGTAAGAKSSRLLRRPVAIGLLAVATAECLVAVERESERERVGVVVERCQRGAW